MAHKKGQGSSRNGRDSNPKMLGIKLFGDEYAKPSSVICRQHGTKWIAGKNCFYGRDWTIHAKVEGFVYFDQKGRRINVRPIESSVSLDESAHELPNSEWSSVGVSLKELRRSRSTRSSLSSGRPIETYSQRISPSGPPPSPEVRGSTGHFLDKLLKGGRLVPTNFKDLRISEDRSRQFQDPGFGAIVAKGGSSLQVPTQVAIALKKRSIHSASEFVSYLRTYPSLIASDLSMDIKQVERACEVLVDKLHGFVEEDFLVPIDTSQFGMGALVPNE